jgi:hypothetical protein
VLPALSCLSTLIDVYSVSQGHAKIILSEIIKLIELGDKDCQIQTAGISSIGHLYRLMIAPSTSGITSYILIYNLYVNMFKVLHQTSI